MSKLLIVDDEVNVCMTLREIFEDDGLDVDTTDNAGDALHLALHGNYDLIIMDIRMPGINGLEGVRSIKLVKPEQEIIIITGMNTPGIRELALEAGARECLFKPEGVREVRKLVKDFLPHATGSA